MRATLRVNGTRRRLASVALASACFIVPATGALTLQACRVGPTLVAQGLVYAPGHPAFDDFFSEFHQLQVELGEAPNLLTTAQSSLAERLDVSGSADAKTVARKASERAYTIAEKGVAIKLAVAGTAPLSQQEPSAKLSAPGTLEHSDRKFADALRSSLHGFVDLLKRMPQNAKAAKKLRVRATELEAMVDGAFRSPTKKSEVRDNLADALKLVPLMIDRCESLEEEAREWLDALDDGVNSPQPPSLPGAAADAEGATASPPKKPPAPDRADRGVIIVDESKPKKRKPVVLEDSKPAPPPEPATSDDTAPPPADDFEP